MPQTLAQLEDQRRDLLLAMGRLGDFRPGSISGIIRRCGKPACRCAKPGAPGHGPSLRLTCKVDGKTRSEALPTLWLLRKAKREIAEFQRFRQLCHSLVRVSENICRLRSVEETLPR